MDTRLGHAQCIIPRLISKVASDWSNRLNLSHERAGFGFAIGFCMEGFERDTSFLKHTVLRAVGLTWL